MLKDWKGDYRIMRVVMASSDPIDTLHKIRTGQYSVITLLDMLEMLDVKDTIMEDEMKNREMIARQDAPNKRN
jgi:hypothetical protein